MNNTPWSKICLDSQLMVIETSDFDQRLFFGKQPVSGKTLWEQAEKDHFQQVHELKNGIERSIRKRGNSSFVYSSVVLATESIRVCVHVQYQSDQSLILYLIELYEDDSLDIQTNKECRQVYRQVVTVLDSLPVGVGVYSSDGTPRYYNRETCRIFGVELDDAVKNAVNLYESPILPESLKEAVRNGKSVYENLAYNFKALADSGYLQSSRNDTDVVVECTGQPILNEKGEVENYVFILQDNTEKVRAEQALSQNKEKTEIAMQAANVTLWEFDIPTLTFHSYNEPLNNYDDSRLIPLDEYMKHIHPEDIVMISEYISRVINREEISFNFDFRIMLQESSEWQYCSINGSPYSYAPDGTVTQYVGIRKNNTVLQKRKLLQEKILNSIPLSIHIKDVENGYRYTFCNDESKRLFGTRESYTTHDVIDAEYVEYIRKTDMEVFRTGEPYQGVEHVVLRNGNTFDTIVRKSVIEDEGKRLLLSIRWDQSLQNDLLRRSKLLSLTLEVMTAFTWFYEPGKEEISFSDDFEKYGRKRSEVNTLQKYLACVHPDDADRFASSLSEVLVNESGVWRMEFRFDQRGDGQYTWWEARGLLETIIQNEMPHKYMFGMSICVDKYKQTEQQLNQLIRQNELILNNTSSGLAYITKDYVVQWENVSVCSASLSYEAYKKGELCYKSAHNRTSPCPNCVLQRAIKSHQMENIQFALDNNHQVEVFATPVFDKDDVFDGIVIRVDDVTERQTMIQELHQAKAQAEQSDRLKSAFLANMSHEIRTPLNAIVGFSELLLNIDEEEERREYIGIIKNNNELLLNLINDILDLSKIEAGSIEFVYEDFDLSEYFNGMVLSMRQRITNPNVHLVGINPYKSCRITQDRNRIAQLVTNYVTNAIKFTSKGFIEMSYSCVEGGIRLCVKDSGIGIPDEKKSRLFQRFAKLDEFAQGTGLGLSICKAIAESMNGHVGFESTYGEGSCFWAFLPCEPIVELDDQLQQKETIHERLLCAPSLLQDSTEITSSSIFTRKTILVAEDMRSNYLLLSSILQKDYNLIFARNGQQAVELVKDNPIDLVLMDMKMPIMDGLTATREIRKFNPLLPIVALTAHAFESDRQAAFEAGCNEYIVKPIDKVRLIEVLTLYCSAGSE